MKPINKIKELYRGKGFTSIFVNIRFWDAPIIELEKFVPKGGEILDLGCGEGISTNYLALTSSKRKIIGIEINKERLKNANHGLPNVEFKAGNILKTDFTSADAIILTHVLHHLKSYKEQELLLNKCCKVLKKNGKLIILEVDDKPYLKYLLSKFVDSFVVPVIFEKKMYDKVFFRNEKQWRELISPMGFKISCKCLDEDKPFSHILFVATKN